MIRSFLLLFFKKAGFPSSSLLGGRPGQLRKLFFSEEKNQKTFDPPG
jgi:hypothetical protein